MRVAITGTCGLALFIAKQIRESTSHQLLILSRIHQPSLVSQGYQCQIVDYEDPSSLQYALMGVDTVISTVAGNSQLRLIEAAVHCRVRRFAPAEFEGQPGLRRENTILDRGKSDALALLQHYRNHIQSTVFVCGILYERFAVNGMASCGIGVNTGYGREGDYMINPRSMIATAPIYDAAQNNAFLCLTSAFDVARFVVRSLDMPNWAPEMSMCSERMTVHALLRTIEVCRARPWNSITWENPTTLQHQITVAEMREDVPKQQRLATLLATAEGRYDFVSPAYLNTLFPGVRPIAFREWFLRNWASVP